MVVMMAVDWKDVLPAVTTQVAEDMSIDLDETQRVVDDLIKDGVSGIIALGTVGENNSLMYEEKIATLTAIVEAVAGRVPVITGASEYDARRAIRYGQAAAKAGANGLMLLPPMVYVRSEEHTSELQSLMRNSYAVFCLKKK